MIFFIYPTITYFAHLPFNPTPLLSYYQAEPESVSRAKVMEKEEHKVTKQLPQLVGEAYNEMVDLT